MWKESSTSEASIIQHYALYINIYLWWMHKWVKTSPIKFDSEHCQAASGWLCVKLRGSQLFLKEVTGKYHKATLAAIPKCWIQKSLCSLCGHVTDWLFYSFFFFFFCLVWFYCLWSITCSTSTLKSPKSFSKSIHTGVMEKWVRVRVKGQSEWKQH